MCSTPRDLVRWARFLATGAVVEAESYAAMTRPTRLADGREVPYGYGLAMGRLGDVSVIQHGGGINGFGSYLAHYPDHDLTIAIIVNGPASAGRLQEKVARMLLGIPETEMIYLPMTAAERALFAGDYDLAPTLPLQLRVFEQEERLYAQATGQGPFPLQYQGDHVLMALGGTLRMVFTIEGDQATGFMLEQGGSSIAARRIEP